jgi:hypothetical protein
MIKLFDSLLMRNLSPDSDTGDDPPADGGVYDPDLNHDGFISTYEQVAWLNHYSSWKPEYANPGLPNGGLIPPPGYTWDYSQQTFYFYDVYGHKYYYNPMYFVWEREYNPSAGSGGDHEGGLSDREDPYDADDNP